MAPAANAPLAVATSAPASTANTAALAPTLKENYTGPSVSIPTIHYDSAHAILPDPKLTPGDVFPDATKDDVCTPGWSREYRHVTEEMRDKVYEEYGGDAWPRAVVRSITLFRWSWAARMT